MNTLDSYLSDTNINVLAYQKENKNIIYVLLCSDDENKENRLLEYNISEDTFYYYGGIVNDDKHLRNVIMFNKVSMETNLGYINQIKL